jgi:hypothetical protein
VKAEDFIAKLPPKEEEKKEEKKEDKKEDKKEAKRKKAAEKKEKLLREKEEKKRAKEEKKKRKKSKGQKIDDGDKIVKAVQVIVEEEVAVVELGLSQNPAAHNSGGHNNNNVSHGQNVQHATTNQAEQIEKIDIASSAGDEPAEFQFSPPPPPQVRAQVCF